MKVIAMGRTADLIFSCAEHKNDEWEIVIVTYGNGKLYAENNIIDFSKNSVYAVPPGVLHKSISKNGFEDTYIRIKELNLPADSITHINPGTEDFVELSKILYRTYYKNNNHYNSSVYTLTDALISLLTDAVNENCIYSFTAAVRDYLNSNFSNTKINSFVISEAFGYNYEYLSRCFKEDFGATPMQFLNLLRIKHAKALLSSRQKYSVEKISIFCGFSDKFYFSRAFKKATGYSPVKYRQINSIHNL